MLLKIDNEQKRNTISGLKQKVSELENKIEKNKIEQEIAKNQLINELQTKDHELNAALDTIKKGGTIIP